MYSLNCFLSHTCSFSSFSPYSIASGDDELRIYRKILSVPFSPQGHFSAAASDLIGQLLNKDPASRLGVGPLGMAALKRHPWFQAIDWGALMEHRWARGRRMLVLING